jgi:5-methylcytosine-specific restriction endonuclease McrA
MAAFAGSHEELEQAMQEAFWTLYENHLSSIEWAKKRRGVLKRSNGVCEGCGESAPEHVHHLTYEHLGDEFLFELVAICAACHQRIHPHRELDTLPPEALF